MTIGILGGGQLGRMLILAGVPLGLRFRVLDPAREAATDVIAPRVIGEYEDFAVLAEFVRGLDAVTYEFENVPVATARWLGERVPVFPPPEALEVAQDRVLEKEFLQRHGVPVPNFQSVATRADYDRAIAVVGLPAVLKTRRFGYDGKGQTVVRSRDDIEPAWQSLGGRPLILEQWIAFDRELSVIAVRAHDGVTLAYPLTQNEHVNGILAKSVAGSKSALAVSHAAQAIAGRIMSALNYVGTLAIEFFDTGGHLVVNEMAPRVHNSGHWTVDGAATSQFENHLRAGVGLPLGETTAHGPCAMLNLIGSLPQAADILAIPGTHWHDYGKSPRAGRKVGHVTLTAPDDRTFSARLERLEAVLKSRIALSAVGS
ncbi:MAG: 5-(carboxyamino)imidazole ribonucleotide synthase [Gemmataceae bacterium]